MAWAEYGTIVTVPARGTALRRGFVPIPFAIRRALDRLVPDQLEVADRLSFRQLGVWARDNRVPAVLFADDVAADLATDRAWENYDRVVCGIHSATLTTALSASGSVVTMRPFIDLEIFTPLRHNSTLRDASGAELIVVCASPLTATGSVSLAIDAIRELTDQGTDVLLVVLGDGPLRSRLERSAHGLPVQFLSASDLSLSERSEVLATADFALVTVDGSVGHAVALEALASGTPVIMSGFTVHSIDFRDGGGLTTEADPAQIVHAVSILGEKSVESRRRAARETALAFDAMPLSRAMVELHESLS